MNIDDDCCASLKRYRSLRVEKCWRMEGRCKVIQYDR